MKKVNRKRTGFLGLLLVAGFLFLNTYGVRANALTTTSQTAQSSSSVSTTAETTAGSQTTETTETTSAAAETTDTAAADTASDTSSADSKRTILDGIHIGALDVSGMTEAEATNAVTAYVEDAKSYLMTLNMGSVNVSVTAGDMGLHWGNPEVVKEAAAMGKQGNAVCRYKAKKKLAEGNNTLALEFAVTDSVVKSILENRCASACNTDPIEPQLDFSGDTVTATDGQTGCTLNVDASLTAIQDYFQKSWGVGAGSISLVCEVTQPKHTKEDLSGMTDILGKADTDYSSSSESRSTNIETAAKLVNGTVLYPGETFSTLGAITPFTEENGYAIAGSYANGQVTESFGGGICQVSTTLYLAVLRSELEVTERKNHSMIVTYVKPSMDAAIAESSDKDFKFKNNLDHPIYISMSAYHGTLAARIYGTEYRDSNRTVKYESVTLSTEEAETTIKTTSSLDAGVINRKSTAHNGVSAELYKVVTVNGKEESREKVNSSSYAKTDGVIEVGIAGATTAQVKAISAAVATNDIKQVKAAIRSLGL